MNKSFGFIDLTLQKLQERLYRFCDLPGEKQVVKRLHMLMVINRAFKLALFHRNCVAALPFGRIARFYGSAGVRRISCLT